uniref:Uncharacterized protein n=1 Tax=Glossina pallidipes TaxID=7398 RepID=A0A1B0A4D6_GLOPL
MFTKKTKGVVLPSSPTLATYFSNFLSSCSQGVHSLLTDNAKILLAVSRMEAPALGGFGVAAPSTSLRSPLLELSSLGSESALLAGVARSLGATDSSGVLLVAPLVIEDGVLRPTPALGPVPPRPPPRLPGCDIETVSEKGKTSAIKGQGGNQHKDLNLEVVKVSKFIGSGVSFSINTDMKGIKCIISAAHNCKNIQLRHRYYIKVGLRK